MSLDIPARVFSADPDSNSGKSCVGVPDASKPLQSQSSPAYPGLPGPDLTSCDIPPLFF